MLSAVLVEDDNAPRLELLQEGVVRAVRLRDRTAQRRREVAAARIGSLIQCPIVRLTHPRQVLWSVVRARSERIHVLNADEHAVAGAVIGEACAIARRQNGPPVVGLAVGKHHIMVDIGPSDVAFGLGESAAWRW